MKTITIAGRLGKDSEFRRTQNGDPVLSFGVAVDHGYGDKKTTMWLDCSLFGKRGESLEQYLKKGSAVTVSGDFSTREYDGKTYLQIRANDVTLQGGKPANSYQEQSMYDRDDDGGKAAPLDDEIPF